MYSQDHKYCSMNITGPFDCIRHHAGFGRNKRCFDCRHAASISLDFASKSDEHVERTAVCPRACNFSKGPKVMGR